MKWSVHPAKNNQVKAIIVVLFVIGFLAYVGVFFGVFWSIFGLVVLFLSSYSFYFPTHYEITDDAVIIKGLFTKQKRLLKEFKKTYTGKNGILLSPFRHKSFLNRFRGVFLFLPDEREKIISFIRDKVEQAGDGNSPIDRHDSPQYNQ